MARQLEILLKAVLADERFLDVSCVKEIDTLLMELRVAATRPDDWGLDLLDEQLPDEQRAQLRRLDVFGGDAKATLRVAAGLDQVIQYGSRRNMANAVPKWRAWPSSLPMSATN